MRGSEKNRQTTAGRSPPRTGQPNPKRKAGNQKCKLEVHLQSSGGPRVHNLSRSEGRALCKGDFPRPNIAMELRHGSVWRSMGKSPPPRVGSCPHLRFLCGLARSCQLTSPKYVRLLRIGQTAPPRTGTPWPRSPSGRRSPHWVDALPVPGFEVSPRLP